MKKIYTIFASILFISAFSQSGSLDATFGNNGKVYTGFSTGPSRANAVAVQPDGKIIIAGYAHTANTTNTWERDSDNFVLVRYNADGSIDTSFGYDGKAMTDFYPFYTNNLRNGSIHALKLQPDGKILAYGNADSQTVVVRYNSNGMLDTAFGTGGILRCNSTLVEGGNTLGIQPDGKIVVLGMQWIQPIPNTFTTQFVVERYNADGSIDTTFATNGRVVTAFGNSHDMPRAMTLQPDGKIVVVGISVASTWRFAMARYTTNGALDTTFDGDGKVITATGGEPKFVTVHADGKIIAAGNSGATDYNFTLLKFNSNGSLDTSFDGDGIALNTFGANDQSNTVVSVAEQPDGKFLVTTSADTYGSYDIPDDLAVRRYNSNGTTDTSFGENGKVVTTVQQGFNIGKYIALQADGKLLVAGYSRPVPFAQSVSCLVRYDGNGILDGTFDSDGKITATFDATNDESNILLIQPDNKLIAIGTKRNATSNGYLFKEIALSRYNGDGSLDASFGTGGKVITAGNMNSIKAAVLQPDGKIIVANTYYNTSIDNLDHFELIRYGANGAIDESFGTNGRVTTEREITSLLALPGGKIISVSIGLDPQNNIALMVKRYNANGTLDNSFGSNGTAIMAGNFWGEIKPLLQPDGKIVVAYSSTDENGVIGFNGVRFNADGSIDSSFQVIPLTIDNASLLNGAFIQPDGKIILTGRSTGFSEGNVFWQFMAARYNPNGSLDATYGTNGVAASYLGNFYTPYTEIRSVVQQPDGKFLVALSKEEQNPANPSPGSYDFVIRRFNAEGGNDNDFGALGETAASFYNKYDEAFAMVLQPDHKIVVAGTTDTGINRDFALVRFNNAITLDLKDHDANPGSIVLYPNPVKNTLNLSNSGSNPVIDYTIYDMLGKVVHKGSSAQVDTSGFNRGIYIMFIRTDKGVINKKFVKE